MERAAAYAVEPEPHDEQDGMRENDVEEEEINTTMAVKTTKATTGMTRTAEMASSSSLSSSRNGVELLPLPHEDRPFYGDGDGYGERLRFSGPSEDAYLDEAWGFDGCQYQWEEEEEPAKKAEGIEAKAREEGMAAERMEAKAETKAEGKPQREKLAGLPKVVHRWLHVVCMSVWCVCL